MADIKFNNKLVLNLSLDFKNSSFISFNIKEKILGPLPELTFTVKTSEDICQVGEEIKGSLINEKGNMSIKFDGYVYSVTYVNNKYVIKVLCVKPDFLKKTYLSKFDSMNDAIKYLYPGEIVSNTKSDLMNDMTIFQKDINNYKLLTKCLDGYKENTIYGFALGDLRINDLKNWKPKLTLASRVNIKPIDATELTEPTLYSLESEIINYNDGKDLNHSIVKFYDRYIPVNKEYENFVANILHNSRFKTMKSNTNYVSRELFPINITDSVKVGNSQIEHKHCFISSRVIDFNDNKMQVFYAIQSIDPL